MTWVNLNNVYLPQAGGTVTGNLQVNGNLTINDKTGNGTLYNVASEITALRDSVSHIEYFSSTSSEFTFTPKYGGIIIAQVFVSEAYGAWGGQIGLHVQVPDGLTEIAAVSTSLNGNDGVKRFVTAKSVMSGAIAGKSYYFKSKNNPNAGWAASVPWAWMLEVRPQL